MSLTVAAIILAALGGGVVVLDWLIEDATKKRHKERVYAWWYKLHTFTWRALLADAAQRVLRPLAGIVGDSPRSLRFIGLSVAGSLLLSVPLLATLVSVFNPVENVLGFTYWVVVPLAAVTAWVGLVATMRFLQLVIESPNVMISLLVIALELGTIVVIYMVVSLPTGLMMMTLDDIPTDLDRLQAPDSTSNWQLKPLSPENQATLAAVEPTQDFLALAVLIPLVGALLPTLFHVVTLSFLAIAKLTRPVLQPLTILLLARVHDDKRSVLTLVGIGLTGMGAMLKGLEELLKAMK